MTGNKVPPCGLDRIWEGGEKALHELASSPPRGDQLREWRALAEEQILWGGFPALEPLTLADRTTWLKDFRRTYLERDLADLGRVVDLDQFALAQNLLAARTAQLLSYSEVARDLGVAVNTVKRYVRFLEISYQVLLLRPLLPTVTARIVKSPKLYWTDPGVARMLSERFSADDGAMFETAVLAEILRWASWQADPPSLHFHRLHGGHEVDFILRSTERLLFVEGKGGRREPGPTKRLAEMVKGLRVRGMSRGAPRVGLVVYRGDEVKRLAPGVWAVPYWRLFGPV